MDETEFLFKPLFHGERSVDVRFPLTAVVGHQGAKRALILSLINPGLSLLIYGDRGLGKKTLMMSASNFMPVVKSTGCHFNCEPGNRVLMCTECAKGGWVARDVRAPFVIFPYTVNTEMLLGTPENPSSSVLGSSNRGVLAIRDMENYSSEILDIVFESLRKRKVDLGGFVYPTFFQTLATYNGSPSLSLLENFVLKARVSEVRDVEERIEILRRVEMFRKNPRGFYDSYGREEERLAARIEDGRRILKKIGIPDRINSEINSIVEEYGLKKDYSRRLVMASATNAAYEGRISVSGDDLREVMRLVLPDHKT